MVLLPSVAHAIGGTPLVSLTRFCKHHGIKGEIYAKLEYLNPGFSKKDRIARQMIQEALNDKKLKMGQPVIELTSGNTGTGLAIACISFGNPFTAVMSKGNSIERARMMKALGTNVVLVEQDVNSKIGYVSAKDLELVQNETNRLVKELKAFRADQFNLMANENAHYLETGPEIWKDAQPKAFVDVSWYGHFLEIPDEGTGGSFSGISRFLKEKDPKIECYWVEPNKRHHQIQGGGYFTSPSGENLKFYELAKSRGHIDGTLLVSDDESIETARDIARLEGIFGGFSSGANVAAAVKILKKKDDEKFSVVCLICDSGLKYLSLDLY